MENGLLPFLSIIVNIKLSLTRRGLIFWSMIHLDIQPLKLFPKLMLILLIILITLLML